MVAGQQYKTQILLIGAGQLGSRHLQALAKLRDETDIYVIDPSNVNLQTASQRFQAVEGHEKHEAHYHNQFEDMDLDHVDVGIVATNANVRATIIQNVHQHFNLDYLILEKFLFQKVEDYYRINELLDRQNTKCYVNCPRRLFKAYQDLKDTITASKPVQMEVVGNNWGLGCNGIHFVDLFHFLTGQFIENWYQHLDNDYINSKREGFIEFSGALTGYSERGDVLSLRSYEEGKPNISVRISSTDYRWVIAEGLGQLWEEIITENDWKIENDKFEMPLQSNLTNLVVEDLIHKWQCSLTPFQDSSKLHLPFLNTLLKHYEASLNEKVDTCPIT
jgi:predicted dehydrogenase